MLQLALTNVQKHTDSVSLLQAIKSYSIQFSGFHAPAESWFDAYLAITHLYYGLNQTMSS